MRRILGQLASAAAILAVGATAGAAQTLKIGLSSEPTAIDPHYHDLTPNNALNRHIYDALTRSDPRYRDGGFSRGEVGWLGVPLDAKTDWKGEVKDLLQRSFALVTGMKPARSRKR